LKEKIPAITDSSHSRNKSNDCDDFYRNRDSDNINYFRNHHVSCRSKDVDYEDINNGNDKFESHLNVIENDNNDDVDLDFNATESGVALLSVSSYLPFSSIRNKIRGTGSPHDDNHYSNITKLNSYQIAPDDYNDCNHECSSYSIS
jgi:hypothetical protein